MKSWVKYSNIIVINNEGKIIDSIKRVDGDMSRERIVLPGMSYEFPPRDDRISFVDSDEKTIRSTVSNLKNAELSKALISAFEGVFLRFLLGNGHFMPEKAEN